MKTNVVGGDGQLYTVETRFYLESDGGQIEVGGDSRSVEISITGIPEHGFSTPTAGIKLSGEQTRELAEGLLQLIGNTNEN